MSRSRSSKAGRTCAERSDPASRLASACSHPPPAAQLTPSPKVRFLARTAYSSGRSGRAAQGREHALRERRLANAFANRTREATPTVRARLALIGPGRRRPLSQGNGRCSQSSYVQEATGLRVDCPSCDRSAQPSCGATNACRSRRYPSQRSRSSGVRCVRIGARLGEVDCGLGSERRTNLDLRDALSTSLAARRGFAP
jgi:hypothetical protein